MHDDRYSRIEMIPKYLNNIVIFYFNNAYRVNCCFVVLIKILKTSIALQIPYVLFLGWRHLHRQEGPRINAGGSRKPMTSRCSPGNSSVPCRANHAPLILSIFFYKMIHGWQLYYTVRFVRIFIWYCSVTKCNKYVTYFVLVNRLKSINHTLCYTYTRLTQNASSPTTLMTRSTIITPPISPKDSLVM